MSMNKHYILTNVNCHIFDGWCSAEYPDRKPTPTDILLREDNNKHFRLFEDGEDNPVLCRNGIDLYLWDGSNVIERDASDIEADRMAGIESVKEYKIVEFSEECNRQIIAGCDVELSDGITGHISLTVEDQMNISNAMRAVESGAEEYPYHLDGQTYTVYSANDIRIINAAAELHKVTHLSYFSHMKSYIRECMDPEIISDLKYGDELPESFSQRNAATILSL